ncbi:MAG: penicillin-binding protein 2 [Lachnospiraceae bacterium]|nr:penicillin-binding protein 2 [Lachnospiraceae bacterium]
MIFKRSKNTELNKEDEKAGNKQIRETANKDILFVTYVFVLVFAALISYVAYFAAIKSDSVINNAYNSKRAELLAQKVIRGEILSRDGEVLAKTVYEDGTEVREYPYGPLFAHSVGFFTQGSIGVESIANFTLLKSDDPVGLRLRNDLNGIKNRGDNVTTTFDIELQKTADLALGDRKGAVLVLDVRTGEILAMVSKPDFDPGRIDEIWEAVNEDTENSPLLNRATQGVYPPGSTFKIVTALEFMKEYPEAINDYEFDCNGSFEYEDVKISCYHDQKHGHLDLGSSFARSCNSSFAHITSGLNRESFNTTCNELLFDSRLPSPFSYKKSYVDLKPDTSIGEVIQAGIGQGKTMITPIHMAMITSAIANNGILMRPMVIKTVKNAGGSIVRRYEPQEYGRLVSEDNAAVLRSLMREVVVNGTGSKLLGTQGYEAAGKTGSAEYSKNKSLSHAWFTGFAPFDDPRISVTVIVEGAGTGGDVAAPIARSVFDTWYANAH